LLAIGFQFATARLEFLDDNIEQLLQTSYFLLYLFVVLATVWRAGDFLVDWYITGNSEQMNQNLVTQVVPLLKRLAHFALLLIAVVIAASYFGVDVLAISAALGLSGFALALAAKDTITNIISGFVLMVSQPFKVGDRIDVASLDSWGNVVEIGIRSTNVLMRDNRLVIVPNSSIVDNTVVNYSMPDSTYRLQSDIGIGYGVDILQISKKIKETVAKVDGVLPDKNIDVWFTEFGESSNTFRVRWWVSSYADKRRSTHDVNTAIQLLSEQLPIEMPNPTFTLDNKISLGDDEIESVSRVLNTSK
jgi:small-conductance mechanosensitive channel